MHSLHERFDYEQISRHYKFIGHQWPLFSWELYPLPLYEHKKSISVSLVQAITGDCMQKCYVCVCVYPMGEDRDKTKCEWMRAARREGGGENDGRFQKLKIVAPVQKKRKKHWLKCMPTTWEHNGSVEVIWKERVELRLFVSLWDSWQTESLLIKLEILWQTNFIQPDIWL